MNDDLQPTPAPPAGAQAIDFVETVPFDFRATDSGQTAAGLVEYAVDLPASDLFINSDDSGVSILVRHLGILKRITTMPKEEGRRLMYHFKAIAGMDVGQRMRPEDGRWVFGRRNGHKVDLRMNSIPTLYGEDLAIRILDRNLELMDLANLGLHPQDLAKLQNMLASPSGMILVTGPMGAGKTSTLYACLNHVNDGKRKINTIEDPIEYALDGVRQSQVNLKAGVDFPEMLRNVLRQSADVIMIGEIRDPMTAETAVRAAKSGQLVFATLHAATAPAAVETMLALDVHPHFLATSLLGIVAQRLVRALCPACRVPVDISESPQTFEELRKWIGPDEGKYIYTGTGCLTCHFDGHVGRSGVFELMTVSKKIRQMIASRQTVRDIREQAIKEGMIDVRRSALLKVAAGITSMEEVMRVIPAEQLLPDDDR
jgi:type II secretory ATPase GspE/PulE/Tfp pilus assembly ATPase PilB-like protein